MIKAPGTLYVVALEINPQGVKTPFNSWTVPPEKLRLSWKQGLLSTGYSLILPWKNFPQTDSVRIVVRMVTPDGRIFETDKDVRVRLVPNAPRRMEGPLDFPPAPTPVDPFALPAAHLDRREPNSATTASHWQPVPLDNAVQLGQPIPITTSP